MQQTDAGANQEQAKPGTDEALTESRSARADGKQPYVPPVFTDLGRFVDPARTGSGHSPHFECIGSNGAFCDPGSVFSDEQGD